MPSCAFNHSGSPPVDHRSRLGCLCNIPIILSPLCECSPERLPCPVECLKATHQFPRPYPSFTSYLYKVYETIPPLVTTWYTIWAKVIVIVATYRRVVTAVCSKGKHSTGHGRFPCSLFSLRDCLVLTGTKLPIVSTTFCWVYPSFSSAPHGRIGWHPTASTP